MKKILLIFTAMTLGVFLSAPPKANAVLAGFGGSEVGVGIAIAAGGVVVAVGGIWLIKTAESYDNLFAKIAQGILGVAVVITGIALEKNNDPQSNTFNLLEDLDHKKSLGIYTQDEVNQISREVGTLIDSHKTNPLLIPTKGLENVGQLKKAVQENTHLSDLSTSYLIKTLLGAQI